MDVLLRFLRKHARACGFILLAMFVFNPVVIFFLSLATLPVILAIGLCEWASHPANEAKSRHALRATEGIRGAGVSWSFLFLGLLSLAAVVISAVLRERAGGWLLLYFFFPYLFILAYHLCVHIRLARAMPRRHVIVMVLIIFSHCVLIIGFLLQWDIGDGYSWLVISALLGEGPGYTSSQPPTWMRPLLKSEPFGMLFWSLLVLTPTFASWHWLNRSYRHISS